MKTRNRWRSTVRMLGAGIALVLILGASGEGCSGGSGSDEATCPRAEAAVAAGTAVSLPYGDEEEDLERAHDIAQRVADVRDGTGCVLLTQNEKGYRVTIPFKKGRPILVRVMARSKRRENYYRVSVSEKGAVDKDGNYSSKAEDTHHDLPDDVDDAVDEILDLIDKTKEKHQ